MAKPKLNFDSLFYWLMAKLHLKIIADYYMKNGWFQRTAKFGVTTTIMYWFLKGPMIYAFTEWLHVWYILSAFLVGLILTLVGVVFNELWIYKR